MRWTVKIVEPIAEETAQVSWEHFPVQAAARERGTMRRSMGQFSEGTVISTHQCFNDEPDETRKPCVMDQRFVKRGAGWVRDG